MMNIFIILIFFPLVCLASYCISNVLLKSDSGPFKKVFWFFCFIGVIVHELSHFIMCILVGVKPKGISIKLKSERTGKVSPSGWVRPEDHNCTFLQAVLISLAPTIFSTWLFFFALSIFFNQALDPFIRVIALNFCFSLAFGAAPSKQDFKLIGYWFNKDPRYSIYQIFLVFLSAFLAWVLIIYYAVILPVDIIYYILVGIGYYILKYFFRGIRWIISALWNRNRMPSHHVKYSRFIRRRFKPTKPSKLGKKEAQW